MNVASLDVCKHLHAISGWEGTAFSWYCDETFDDTPALNVSEPLKVVGGVGYYDRQYPAYDLAFLVGKLPGFTLIKRGNGDYFAEWRDYASGETISEQSRNNPANAVARLALTLVDAGILLAA